jgi:uncharacterized protein
MSPWDDFLTYVVVGLLAQLVDGAIGMAYGITSTAVLLNVGIAPATASACVHAAETFTTAASGFAHWRLKNVDKSLVVRLAVPGVIGGVTGAYVLTHISGETMRPYVSGYLLLLGVMILFKAYRGPPGHTDTAPPRHLTPLGFFGGLLDAIGGGGWGAVVTSTLIGNGMTPRYVIGSVNLAEFFVTAATTTAFFVTIGLSNWRIVAGLVVGGIIAAPFAAYATKHLPARAMMAVVGTVVILLSARGLLKSFG